MALEFAPIDHVRVSGTQTDAQTDGAAGLILQLYVFDDSPSKPSAQPDIAISRMSSSQVSFNSGEELQVKSNGEIQIKNRDGSTAKMSDTVEIENSDPPWLILSYDNGAMLTQHGDTAILTFANGVSVHLRNHRIESVSRESSNSTFSEASLKNSQQSASQAPYERAKQQPAPSSELPARNDKLWTGPVSIDWNRIESDFYGNPDVDLAGRRAPDNPFSPLSVESAHRIQLLLDKYFSKIDRDGNGYMTDEELIAFYRNNYDNLSPGERKDFQLAMANSRFIADSSNDEWGRETSGITRNDVACLVESASADAQGPLTLDDAQQISSVLRKYFKDIDRHGSLSGADGFITADEIREFLLSEKSRSLSSAEVNAMAKAAEHAKQIMQASNDESWLFKDNRGITQRDLQKLPTFVFYSQVWKDAVQK
jgi:hypothetical protein